MRHTRTYTNTHRCCEPRNWMVCVCGCLCVCLGSRAEKMATSGTMRRQDCLFVNYGGAPIGRRCHNTETGAKDGRQRHAHVNYWCDSVQFAIVGSVARLHISKCKTNILRWRKMYSTARCNLQSVEQHFLNYHTKKDKKNIAAMQHHHLYVCKNAEFLSKPIERYAEMWSTGKKKKKNFSDPWRSSCHKNIWTFLRAGVAD